MVLPTRFLTRAVAAKLAGDTGTLASATFVNVHLVVAPFTPSPELATGDLTLATADGLAAKAVGDDAQQNFVEPGTGDSIVQLTEPLGGWHWTYTGSTPVTIYGIAVTDSDDSQLLGVEPIDGDPVEVSANGDGFDWPRVYFRIALGSV